MTPPQITRTQSIPESMAYFCGHSPQFHKYWSILAYTPPPMACTLKAPPPPPTPSPTSPPPETSGAITPHYFRRGCPADGQEDASWKATPSTEGANSLICMSRPPRCPASPPGWVSVGLGLGMDGAQYGIYSTVVQGKRYIM